jgi:hypothetical protein
MKVQWLIFLGVFLMFYLQTHIQNSGAGGEHPEWTYARVLLKVIFCTYFYNFLSFKLLMHTEMR